MEILSYTPKPLFIKSVQMFLRNHGTCSVKTRVGLALIRESAVGYSIQLPQATMSVKNFNELEAFLCLTSEDTNEDLRTSDHASPKGQRRPGGGIIPSRVNRNPWTLR